MGGNVALAEDVLARRAVDAVGADEGVRGGGGAVFEAQQDRGAAAVFLVVVVVLRDGFEALVEVGAGGGHAFDELVEEVSAVHGLDAAFGLLVAD